MYFFKSFCFSLAKKRSRNRPQKNRLRLRLRLKLKFLKSAPAPANKPRLRPAPALQHCRQPFGMWFASNKSLWYVYTQRRWTIIALRNLIFYTDYKSVNLPLCKNAQK